MIFVTVGTHEQPFDRLVQCVDNIKGSGLIFDDVFIQSGFSTYLPQFCDKSKMITYAEMKEKVEKARIVITHGGPSSYFMPLQIGKIPVVVPRQYKYGEHVNNHQLDFARKISERYHNIIVVEEIENLKDILINYDSIIKNMNGNIESNNAYFCREFENIVDKLVLGSVK
ncbi:MAG: multidrug MFS transporter [Lachnospiraceae bacterium]|nr:multidrug MFS transporter [Lachnospiraceae bacterium]